MYRRMLFRLWSKIAVHLNPPNRALMVNQLSRMDSSSILTNFGNATTKFLIKVMEEQKLTSQILITRELLLDLSMIKWSRRCTYADKTQVWWLSAAVPTMRVASTSAIEWTNVFRKLEMMLAKVPFKSLRTSRWWFRTIPSSLLLTKNLPIGAVESTVRSRREQAPITTTTLEGSSPTWILSHLTISRFVNQGASLSLAWRQREAQRMVFQYSAHQLWTA